MELGNQVEEYSHNLIFRLFGDVAAELSYAVTYCSFLACTSAAFFLSCQRIFASLRDAVLINAASLFFAHILICSVHHETYESPLS